MSTKEQDTSTALQSSHLSKDEGVGTFIPSLKTLCYCSFFKPLFLPKYQSNIPKPSWAEQDYIEKNSILKQFCLIYPTMNTKKKESSLDFIVDCYRGTKSKEVVKAHLKTILDNTLVSTPNALNFLTPLDCKILAINCAITIDRWENSQKSAYLVGSSDIKTLEQYIKESDVNASVAIGNVNNHIGYTSSADIAYPTHSVTKIFTGILLIEMIHQGILDDSFIDKPLFKQLSKDAIKLLPQTIANHLYDNKVTLRQVMNHEAGIGDYGYDDGTGSYRQTLKRALDDNTVALPDMTSIANFLPFADTRVSKVNEWRYSNLGITLVGLALEYHYQIYRSKNPTMKLHKANFNTLLDYYILKPSGIDCFTRQRPENGADIDKISNHWSASPAGGYWSTTKELAKFGKWLYQKCQGKSFLSLLKAYGMEFYRDGRIEHPGESTSSSAFFSLSLDTGNLMAILANKRGYSLALGVELREGDRMGRAESLVENYIYKKSFS
jgi:CubicO group peptidase (beta-lactamase class C family)